MKKLIIFTIAVIIYFAMANINTMFAEIPVNQTVLTIREDVNTLNLLNGLYLSKEQMTEYLKILNKLKILESQSISNINKLYAKQKLTFLKYRQELVKNQGISKKTFNETKQLDDNFKDAIINYNKIKLPLEEQLEAVLNKNQKVIVNDYIPCLIPPDILKNPSQVGQAEDNNEVKEGLTKIREMNPIIYLVFREFLVNKYFEFYENHLKTLRDSDKNIEKERLFKIFDEARNMNEADFQLNKDALSRRVVAKIKSEMLHYRKCEVHLLGQTLLNVNMIPIIEQRLALTK